MKFFSSSVTSSLSFAAPSLQPRAGIKRRDPTDKSDSLACGSGKSEWSGEGDRGERTRFLFLLAMASSTTQASVYYSPLVELPTLFSLFPALARSFSFPILLIFLSAFTRQASREGDRLRKKEKKTAPFVSSRQAEKRALSIAVDYFRRPRFLFLDSLSTSGSY